MAKWKPVSGETWRKRKRRYPVCGSVWWMPGKVYKAPIGTDPADTGAWEEIGWIPEGWSVQTFGPGALYDSVTISPPSTGKNDAQS